MKRNIMRIIHISASIVLVGGLILFNCTSTKSANQKSVSGGTSSELVNQVIFSTKGDERVIMSNSIPLNFENTFPNSHNPNEPTGQEIVISLPLYPKKGADAVMGSSTQLGSNYTGTGLQANGTGGKSLTKIGIAIDGVILEPGTAEVWNPDTQSRGRVHDVSDVQWSYDGLGAKRDGGFVGMDRYKGHVQPTGLYHYHAITTDTGLFVDNESEESPIIAFAADGFPILGSYGYDQDGVSIIKMYGNYKLKEDGGARQDRNGQNPGGNYDGTFTQDYMFAEGNGDVDVLEDGVQVSILDIANGHVGKVSADELEKYNFSSEYLGEKNTDDNTYEVYHYHITPNYPYLPRMLYGTPDESFTRIDIPKSNNNRGGKRPPPKKR